MNKFQIKEEELKWIAIDLDKTLAYSEYPDFKLGKPMDGAKEAMEELTRMGWKIIIHTARAWTDYEIIENWLLKYKIPFRRIVCGKLFVKYFIDDRAISFNGNWSEVLNKILGKTSKGLLGDSVEPSKQP